MNRKQPMSLSTASPTSSAGRSDCASSARSQSGVVPAGPPVRRMRRTPLHIAALRAGKMATRAVKAAVAVTLVTLVAACGSDGPATVVQQQTSNTSTANTYTGPPAATADVTAFQINLWQNIRVQNRCGVCHHEGGQSPMFARSDDVTAAYQAALPLINATNPSQSTMVLKVGSGHNCW